MGISGCYESPYLSISIRLHLTGWGHATKHHVSFLIKFISHTRREKNASHQANTKTGIVCTETVTNHPQWLYYNDGVDSAKYNNLLNSWITHRLNAVFSSLCNMIHLDSQIAFPIQNLHYISIWFAYGHSNNWNPYFQVQQACFF